MRKIFPLLLAAIIAFLAIVFSLLSDPATRSKKAAESEIVTAEPWPMESSDIPADPTALFGNLDNGMRYIILPNAEPPNRMSLRLHIDVGSLMEEDDQQGLAHFLEHMVFNGTKTHKDANELIRKMQTRGIAFGAHVNAYTSFDETVYMLNLPDLQEDTLNLTFTIMRDFADGALLTQEEIDAERGVILSEKRSRDSVSSRIQEKQFDMLLPKSKISKRFPIGTEEVIKNAQRDRFADLYEKYYIPSRMTFVVVGDVDPAELEERISNTFGTMRNPEIVGKEPDMGVIEVPSKLEASVFSDAELDSTDISLVLVRPFETKNDTKETRASKIPLRLAHTILNRRFERLSKDEGSPISDGGASNNVWFNEVEFGSISVTATEGQWKEAVPLLEQTFRQAIEFGFTDAELSEAKAKYLNAYEQAVRQKETRRSDALASGISRAINDGTVFSTPDTDLELVANALKAIDPAKVHESFTAFWKAPGHYLILTTQDQTADETSNELTQLFTDSSTVKIERPEARQKQPFAYTDFGEPGSIDSQVTVDDLGITQLTLSNQVRINLKQTDFKKDQISIYARIGSGQLSQPKDSPFLQGVASAVFNEGGLAKHSKDELSEILAGKNVQSSLIIGEDSFAMIGSTTPEDQLLQLQLMVAQLTDPGYRPEGLWQFQKGIPSLFQSLKHTISGPSQEMQAWLHADDFRYAVPDQTKLSNYTVEDVRNWLYPELTSAYLEISVIGDFDQEKLIADLLRTFGTLPERAKTLPEATLNSRAVEISTSPQEKVFEYQSKVPQAVAAALWPVDGFRGKIPEIRRLNVLSSIFNDRIRAEIREKLGASYSPQAGASGSDALEDFGYLIGQSMGKPEDIPLLLNTMKTIGAELAEIGATEDELQRALAPIFKALEKSVRDNNYWLSTVLSESQADPTKLQHARERDADYQSISLGEINQLAKKYFQESNLLSISIRPEAAE